MLKKIFKLEINKMMATHSLIDTAIIMTSDGLLVERVDKKSNDLKRLATMGSTLISLGDTIARELSMGACKNMISENENGGLAFMHINHEYLLVTISEKTNSLGLLVVASKNCCTSIKKHLDKIK
jgi:predicted regulator of Ras-like GTPase activity (Roadblock/LC7/MglB family)